MAMTLVWAAAGTVAALVMLASAVILLSLAWEARVRVSDGGHLQSRCAAPLL